jgi:hypothetical protein
MTETTRRHRLDGLEPDNLLAFLALLGLLRSLETSRPDWYARAGWDLDQPPLRPFLQIAEPISREAICAAIAEGITTFFTRLDFGPATDLKLDAPEARKLLITIASEWREDADRYFADICAALMSDAALDPEQTKVEPTPLAYPSVATSNFLKNAIALTKAELPEKRGRDPSYPSSAAESVAQALFAPWLRRDRPVGLRWDPDEAKRHAYQWRAPTKDPPTTQHGANRLAIVGMSALTCVPTISRNRVQLSVVGGDGSGDRFTFAWPIWRAPASFAAIRALLSHPELRVPHALDRFGVNHIRITRRISLDRLRNFTYAEPLVTEAKSGERSL